LFTRSTLDVVDKLEERNLSDIIIRYNMGTLVTQTR